MYSPVWNCECEISLPGSRHVFVFDPTDDQSIPQGKQTKRLSHIFYVPCTGIWQTVWLESVPKNFISTVDLSADMNGEGKSGLQWV